MSIHLFTISIRFHSISEEHASKLSEWKRYDSLKLVKDGRSTIRSDSGFKSSVTWSARDRASCFHQWIDNINSNAINQIDIISNKQMFMTSVDAFFANKKNRRSDEDYIFKLFDDLIDEAARKQVIILTSIIEAKLLAMLHVEKEFIWWIHLFEKLKFNSDQKMIIYNDNLQIIRLLTSEIAKMNIKLRHVDIAQCWLRQSIQQEKIDVEYLFAAHMMIDEMIKLLSSQRHKQFIQQLRLMNVKGLMNDQLEISR